MCRVNSLHSFRTHIQLQTYIIRHRVNKVAALGNNRVHTHNVLLTEGFTQSIYTHESQAGSVQRVDAFMRRISCMCSSANIAYSFAHKAVAAFTNRNSCLRHILICVHLHCHINIIKGTLINQLALAAQEMQLAGLY